MGQRHVLMALIAALLLTACGNGAEEPGDDNPLGLQEAGVLRVGSDIDFPPFEFFEGDEPQGFDIDLMTEVAERLDLEVSWVDASFDTLLAQLAGGEFDAIVSAITITEERRETIEFSEPYFAADQALVVQDGSDITGTDALEGARVGAQAGTTGLEYAQENFTGADIVEFPTYPAAFTQLEADQIDAVLADLPVAVEYAERSPTLQLVEEVPTDELYGIGVQQDNDALRTAINDQLEEIVADGTYAEIYGRWFEGDPPERFRG